MTYLIGEGVQLYGSVVIGGGSIIEDNVVLGHPTPDSVVHARTSGTPYSRLPDLYHAAAVGTTVIGAGSIIRSGTVIYNGFVSGDRFDCGHNVIIREDVRLGNGVYVKNNTEIMKGVSIGNGCRLAGIVADNCRIGDSVSSFGVLTHTYRSYIPPRHCADTRQVDLPEAPVLEDGSIVGRGALVIGPCVVGKGAIVAGNAVVRADVPAGYLAVGVGRLIRRPVEMTATPPE